MEYNELIERREDWVINHEKIKTAYLDYWEQNDCRPTNTEISKITGIGKQTVGLHVRDLTLNEVVLNEKKYSNDVLKGLRSKAMSGDAPAAKLWLQTVQEFSEKKEIKHNITKQSIEIKFTDEIPKSKKDDVDEVEVAEIISEETESGNE